MHSNKNRNEISDIFTVELTDEAFFSYVSIASERLFEHVDTDIGLLETNPYLGRIYDPVYDAARPDFTCRVFYCEHYGIYYRVDEKLHRIIVFAIEDQRRDPKNRFSRFDYEVSPLDLQDEDNK